MYFFPFHHGSHIQHQKCATFLYKNVAWEDVFSQMRWTCTRWSSIPTTTVSPSVVKIIPLKYVDVPHFTILTMVGFYWHYIQSVYNHIFSAFCKVFLCSPRQDFDTTNSREHTRITAKCEVPPSTDTSRKRIKVKGGNIRICT
jgi:hypothetical protein